jgi:predicted metal-dependent HD superfamily phosphohydrolase
MLEFPSACKELGYDRWVSNSLERQYGNLGRHYHNLNHVNAMLELIDTEPGLVGEDRRDLIKATLWHDYIYRFFDNLPGENELLSAVEYCRLTDCHTPDTAVYKMICASSNHAIDQKNAAAYPMVGLFLDFDLGSFAQPWEIMRRDSLNVLLEAEPYYGKLSALRSSAVFMEALLKRDSLYYVKKDWVPVARGNIQRRLGEVYAEIVGLP